MFALVFAAQAIYGLSFRLPAIFKPTLILALDVSNQEFGLAQSWFGVVALLAYFPGGALADRFEARRLMAYSLLSTAIGGVYLATFPSRSGLAALWGFWGITSILMFWAALIRATRDWGGLQRPGQAFGLLEGGRGLIAAAMGSLASWIFAEALPDAHQHVSQEARQVALRWVIGAYTLNTFVGALVAWFWIPDSKMAATTTGRNPMSLRHILPVIKLPAVWLQAVIVIAAYTAHRGIDNYSTFAVDAYRVDEVTAAQISTMTFWVRPFAAVGAGLLADRIRPSRLVFWAFGLLLAGHLVLATESPVPQHTGHLLALLGFTSGCIFALRGTYYALFEEGNIPLAATGTATGLISVIGYTPDIFVPPLTGWLIDKHPGVQGHQHAFLFIAGFVLVGWIASACFRRVVRRTAASGDRTATINQG
jgi:nitrate/nitrite transporter NarK